MKSDEYPKCPVCGTNHYVVVWDVPLGFGKSIKYLCYEDQVAFCEGDSEVIDIVEDDDVGFYPAKEHPEFRNEG